MIRKTNGVVDILRLKLRNKTGGIYSGVRYNIENNMSADGRMLNAPENVVFEIKNATSDIRGNVV